MRNRNRSYLYGSGSYYESMEDKLRDRDIKEADLIVFANDVGLTKAERFEPYKDKIFQTKPHEVIKDPNIIFSGK